MVFATRRLTFRRDGFDTPVEIEIHAPEKTPDSAWRCRYTIGWPEEPVDREVFGGDAVQALILTLQSIGFDIYRSDYHESGHLFSEKPGDGYGFPIMASYREWLIGDDAKYL
jgi:hypothetical protein